MDFQLFQNSLSGNKPPLECNPYLKALWYEKNGDWNRAHQMVQDLEDNKASWIHAYLHRIEGDISNSDYWYHRAGKSRPGISLEKEWEELTREMLD